MEEGPGFEYHLVQEFLSLEKKNQLYCIRWALKSTILIDQIIPVNCSHLRSAMGYILGYRSDYGRRTRVRIPLGARISFSGKKLVIYKNNF